MRWCLVAVVLAALGCEQVGSHTPLVHFRAPKVPVIEPEAPAAPQQPALSPARLARNARIKAESDTGQREGEARARAELKTGLLGFYEERTEKPRFPQPRSSYLSTGDVLQRDYGVRLRSLTTFVGCVPSPDGYRNSAFINAYNEVMRPAIKKRFGDDVFDKASARAEAETKRRQARLPPPRDRRSAL